MKTASMKEKFYILIFILFFSNLIFGQKAKLNISIDDRIETLYSVAYFDNYFLVNKHANIYKNTLDKQLASLKNHRAIALFDTISKKYNFSYYRPIEWILQYSDFPKFEKIKTKSDAEDETITKGKEYLLEEFRNELTKFNQDSLFQNYLKAAACTHHSLIFFAKQFLKLSANARFQCFQIQFLKVDCFLLLEKQF